MALTKVPESLINKTFGTAAESDTDAILASALSAAQSEDTTAISTAVSQAAAANPFSNGLLHVRQDAETTTWVQANNEPAQVTKAQLIAAIRLAGAEQTAVWVMP